MEKNINSKAKAYQELETAVYASLETYSNVHRGSGHNSMVSTHLYEQARDIVSDYLELKKGKYLVIFCTPHRADAFRKQLKPGTYQTVSSKDIGLSVGICAIAVKKKNLPRNVPFQTGGGSTKLMSKEWVIWANAPDKFEAGTPPVINVITFAKALQLMKTFGKDVFLNSNNKESVNSEILYKDELSDLSGIELMNELRQKLIGKNILVPSADDEIPFINLDNSASTPTFSPIWNVFRRTLNLSYENGQSIIQEVKSICTNFLNAPSDDYDIIFTSNTTEAINLVAKNLVAKNLVAKNLVAKNLVAKNLVAENLNQKKDEESIILNTILEHSSNDLPWRMIPAYSLLRLTVDRNGFMDLKELDSLLAAYNKNGEQGKKQIKLVAVSGASNVLGVCNDLAAISRIVHSYGAQLLVDAAQLVAHREIDMEAFKPDYLAFSAHKIYAPFGSGALVVRKGLLNFNAGESEKIQLSGEENVGGIAALGKSLVLLQRIGMNLIRKEEKELTVKLLKGMSDIPRLKLFGIKDPQSSDFDSKIGVILFEIKNMMPNRVARELAAYGGIGVRFGCHCAHIIIKHLIGIPPFWEGFQKVIQFLVPKIRFPGLVRVSLGIENTDEDVDTLIRVLRKIADKSQNNTSKLSKAKMKQQMNAFVKVSASKVYSESMDI